MSNLPLADKTFANGFCPFCHNFSFTVHNTANSVFPKILLMVIIGLTSIGIAEAVKLYAAYTQKGIALVS